MRQGLVEWALVTAFLALAAAGAAVLFGDEIRSAFGTRRPPPALGWRAQGQPEKAAPERAGEEAGSACRRAEAKPEHRCSGGREHREGGATGPPPR